MKIDPIEIFNKNNGWIRMSEAIRQGIYRYTLYSLLDKGVIEQVSRGVYRLTSLPNISDPDIVTVASRCSRAVFCLISALSFHGITTQIPYMVNIALPRNSHKPKIDWPPITVHRFLDQVYQSGIEEHNIDGMVIKIYNVEKTLVDCFRFRNKLGMDVIDEALEFYIWRKEINYEKILEYANTCKVYKPMRSYIESMRPYIELILKTKTDRDNIKN
jgi:predicted transcriptional regulator of viral defense system